MNVRRILLAALLSAPIYLLTGCGSSPTASEAAAAGKKSPSVPKTGAASVSLDLGKVGALSKGSGISLKKLVLVAVSGGDRPDTVRDTSSLSGNAQASVKRVLKLKPKSAWTLFAKTIDEKDSIIHQGASPSFEVELFDTTHVTLVLQSRFTMYTATFKNLPVSIGVGNGTDRIGIALTRLVLKVDGVVKADSTAREWFGSSNPVVLAFDYVGVGRHEIALEAYGTTEKYQGLMYTGSIEVTTVPGEDGNRPVTLNWVGPSTGGVQANIIVGKIGKMDLMPGFAGSI